MTPADVRRRLKSGEDLKYYKLVEGKVTRKTSEEAELFEERHCWQCKRLLIDVMISAKKGLHAWRCPVGHAWRGPKRAKAA